MKRFICLTSTLFLASCMVGPNYQPPENTVTDVWSTPSDTVNCAPITDWWTLFNDPILTKYIQAAAKHNGSVLIAEANILQARALRQISAADLFPQLGAYDSVSKYHYSKNGLILPSIGGAQPQKVQDLFNFIFDATWELDLFGKTRRGVQAAEATIERKWEERNNILLSVIAEMARTYIEVRGYQKQQELTESAIALLEQQLEIVRSRFKHGYASQISYESTLADLATAKANLPTIFAEIYRGVFTLSMLTGELPETLLSELLEPRPLPKVPETIAVGLRSDLLRRRPDIRGAERQLASATAEIGVAIASFFPSITLGAIGGLQSLHLHNLFDPSSNIWEIGGNSYLPLFQGGKVSGNLQVQKAAAVAAYQTYQQTVLQALEESESTLASFIQEKETAHQYLVAAEKYRAIAELSYCRYEKGVSNRYDALTAKKLFISAEQTSIQSQTTVLIKLIALYKALGGGWDAVDSQE